MKSSSLNSKRFVLVDYLQKQVVRLQETVKRLRNSREARQSWTVVPISVVGNHSLLTTGQKFIPQYTWKGGRE